MKDTRGETTAELPAVSDKRRNLPGLVCGVDASHRGDRDSCVADNGVKL